MRKLKEIIKNTNKKQLALGLVLVSVAGITLFCPDMVHASGLTSTKFVSGTKKLFQDGAKVVTVLGPVLAGVFFAYNGAKLSGAEDGEVSQIKKRMKFSALGGILSLVGGTLLTAILNYYK